MMKKINDIITAKPRAGHGAEGVPPLGEAPRPARTDGFALHENLAYLS